VSGYNVTIIAEYLIWLGILFGLWRPKAFWFALVGIFLFVAMIGFPSSAVRAGVMGSILLWAAKNGRLANSRNAIVFSAVVMLAINPLLLRWDIGFQLSFLATLGIVEVAPLWEKYFDRKIRSIWFLEIAIMTLSAQIFVLPIIIFNFHSFSWVFLLANIAVLEIIPATMLLVFLAAVSGFVFFPLAAVFSFLAYILLKYETGAIDFLSRLSWASREVGSFSWQMVAVYYVLIGGIIWIEKVFMLNREKEK